MSAQKSRVAQLLRQSNLEYEAAARGLTSLSAGRAVYAFTTAKLEQVKGTHEQLSRVSIRWSRYCKKKLSRVLYNIDVVKRTPRLQVLDAV